MFTYASLVVAVKAKDKLNFFSFNVFPLYCELAFIPLHLATIWTCVESYIACTQGQNILLHTLNKKV